MEALTAELVRRVRLMMGGTIPDYYAGEPGDIERLVPLLRDALRIPLEDARVGTLIVRHRTQPSRLGHNLRGLLAEAEAEVATYLWGFAARMGVEPVQQSRVRALARHYVRSVLLAMEEVLERGEVTLDETARFLARAFVETGRAEFSAMLELPTVPVPSVAAIRAFVDQRTHRRRTELASE